MSGLFGIFNVGTRGLITQQTAINVTSHNVANGSTEGYSKQRATIQTTTPYGSPSMNSGVPVGQLGTGSEVSVVQRVRDEFLDYKIRKETSISSQYDARNEVLSEAENVFNETSETGISTSLGKFWSAWQDLATTGNDNAKTTVLENTSILANALNQGYDKLQDIKSNTQASIKNMVFEINSKLNEVDNLNKQIISVKVAGLEPNDLMDKRDNLLDTLSSKFNITIDKKQFYGLDVKPGDVPSGLTTPNLVAAAPNDVVSRFSYINGEIKATTASDGTVTIPLSYYEKGDTASANTQKTINIKFNIGSGYSSLTTEQKKSVDDIIQSKVREIDENRVLWADKDGLALAGADGATIDLGSVDFSGGFSSGVTSLNSTMSDLNSKLKMFTPSSGSLKGYMSSQTDVDNYINQLDSLAKTLAFAVNAVHSGMTDVTNSSGTPDKDYMPFFVNSDVAKYKVDGTMSNLDDILAAEDNINAGNISINKEIYADKSKMKIKTHDDDYKYAADNNVDGKDTARALAIAQIKDKKINIQDISNTINSRKDLFNAGTSSFSDVNDMYLTNTSKGLTIDTYFKDTVDKVGSQVQEAKKIVEGQSTVLNQLNESKEAVSGVSLDEEMANLIQYQHAFSANAKIISTTDELLDVVINGLKK